MQWLLTSIGLASWALSEHCVCLFGPITYWAADWVHFPNGLIVWKSSF
uniref:Uncharacterized protein n=1 Tax=Arundo donax TaxID=35708 RepID=A0A0A8ZEC0_ARUDO